MRRSISIVVLFVISIHLVGFYAYFAIRQAEIHEQMRKEVALWPTEKLTVLTIPSSQFQTEWADEMELEWEGKMYDIARLEKQGNTIKIFCLHDSAEDNLLSFLDSVTRVASQDQKRVPTSIIQFISLVFVPSATTSLTFMAERVMPFTFYRVGYHSPSQEHELPPPRD